MRSSEDELSIESVAPITRVSASVYRPRDRRIDLDAYAPGEARGVRWPFLLAAAAFVLVFASNLVSLGFDDLRTTLINANWEFSWSHDVDTILLAIGVGASLIGARADSSDRWLWCATAAILAAFFVDEASALHGQVGNLDKLLYAPLLAALVVCVWRLTAKGRERVMVLFGLGTLLLAFAMHVAGLHTLRPLGYMNYTYQAGVGFKEGTELAGLILVVVALWRRARQTA